MNRALRRHHEQRVKANLLRRERKHPYWLHSLSYQYTDEEKAAAAGKFSHHGCDCSCWMCGNPRRHLGERTLQERKHGYKLHD